MPKTSSSKKGTYYAVKVGRIPGVYTTWAECEAQTKGFSGPIFKKFNSLSEAQGFAELDGFPPSVPSVFQQSAASTSATTYRTKPYQRNSSGNGGLTSAKADVMYKRNVDSFKATQAIVSKESEVGWSIIYTDGACRGNGKRGSRAGVGVWWEDNDPRNIAERCPGGQTNNRGELIAIIRALENTPLDEKVIIKTDSQYSISCIQQWLRTWRTRSFKTAAGLPIKNRELILYLDALLTAKAPGSIRLVHVKAHVGERGNEGADGLAGLGCEAEWREEKDDEWDLAKVDNMKDDQKIKGKDKAVNVDADVDVDVDVDVYIEDSDLLTADELLEMEKNGVFE